MNQRTRFLGLDVHKETIAVAVAEEGSEPQLHSTIANRPEAVRKLVREVGGEGVRLVAAYEAGPTGYAVHRQLVQLGVDSKVVAPSLIPRAAGDRVKTDRRDAVRLARLLRGGDLVPVWIPDDEHEALRDLVRTRADARVDLLRARHRLSKFLLRRGLVPPPGIKAWSLKHQAWVKGLTFTEPAAEVVFHDYRRQVEAAVERVRRLESELTHYAQYSPHLPFIAALQSMRGIALVTAVTIVAEAGDLRRFKTPRQFMAYTGLVPSEHSSGASTYRGRVTKTGNANLRHVLGEAAHHSRHQPRIGGVLKQRQDGVPQDIVDLSWKAQQRLHLRYRHLSARIGRPKALTAVARELAGFVWALGQRMEAPAA
jgi:transposase